MKNHLALATVALAALTSLNNLPSAHGQAADLTFAGGNGAPLSLTLNAPVSYTVNRNAGNSIEVFNFDATGNFINGSFANVSGTIMFTLNGGTPTSFNRINSGYTGGSVTADDSYIFNNAATFNPVLGDTFTLLPGTLTTTTAFAGAPPTSGMFNTFVVNAADGGAITGFGVVPEPSTWALSGVGAILLAIGLRRRQSSGHAAA